MNNEIMKRAMFTMPVSKSEMNSGIMQGFEEQEEEMPQMARTPQNPEILMNNLRGDMRSIDARYMELAQMVGEEAAMETPPEVLAMLQPQLATQSAPPMAPEGMGIMQLPQGQEMMPPPGGPGMPQAMPPGGMEGMPPFQPGGVEQAPPTPDGLPPVRAQAGGFFRSAARYGSEVMPALDQYLGRLFGSVPENVYSTVPMVGADGRPIYLQGRETVRMTPSGPVMGEGTRITPATTLGVTDLRQPSLRRAIGEPFEEITGMAERGLNAARASYPRATSVAEKSVVPLAGAGTAAAMYQKLTTPTGKPAQSMVDQIPDQGPPLRDEKGREIVGPRPRPALYSGEAYTGEAPAVEAPPAAEEKPVAAGAFDTQGFEGLTSEFIKKSLKEEKEAAPKTRMQRIQEAKAEYEPLFSELLGDTKEDMKMNALLLLSDAGFKLASTYQPTTAMALGKALEGMPRGFAGLVAMAKDRKLKIKTATLQQAIDDVNLQDKFARDYQLAVLKANADLQRMALKEDYATQREIIKEGGLITEDAGMGLRTSKTKRGTFIGNSIDPSDPTVTSAVGSRFTLRNTDNPFVEYRGKAPTTVETDKAERIKLGNTLRALDNSLSTLDNLKGTYAGAYSPGTWFSDKINNILVPISGGLIRPDVDVTDTATRISTGMNQIMKSIASANDQGRVAVQEQEWARETAKGIADPTAFFTNKELAAKQFNSMEAMLRNARQQVLTQLGYIDEDYVMRTPNTGTQNDPFIISADPNDQKRMFTFLGSTIGTLQDPNALVYIKMPNGRVDAFNPAQLRGLLPK